MPFTFSHPAIILPLAKCSGRWFSLTGLIAGSMAPDFEYFFRMKIQSNFSHTIAGLFYFDLPTGILLAFVFHNIVKDMLFDNSPKIARSRLVLFKNFVWNQYFRKHFLVVIISILFGSLSHLFWDGFTHIHGYFVQLLPLLQTNLGVAGKDIPVYKLLQHLSTVLGGICIVIVFLSLPATDSNGGSINPKYWGSVFLIFTAILILRLFIGIEKNFFGQLIGTGISAILIALTCTPLLARMKLFNNNGDSLSH